MRAVLIIVGLLFCNLPAATEAGADGHARHGMSMFGELKYPGISNTSIPMPRKAAWCGWRHAAPMTP